MDKIGDREEDGGKEVTDEKRREGGREIDSEYVCVRERERKREGGRWINR